MNGWTTTYGPARRPGTGTGTSWRAGCDRPIRTTCRWPADVRAALAAGGRDAGFARCRPAERRRLLQPIEDAVHALTRRRRIEALVRALPADAGCEDPG
ncbi:MULTISPECIES: YdeI/OmpD-associated family protein [Catenuloplanes]|uniref:Uncharacterized protein n=1 Tax=Catenuloplanes niger TaxID=587534 RepID=A0AAE3ZZY6_9ACTN|nr:YdeI/OmpD-associated family protein [Catenuloplanes niger]MDR7327921.1 hypothetical protein [Catenuloplanes niger]